jgi:hypothetical protein
MGISGDTDNRFDSPNRDRPIVEEAQVIVAALEAL